MSDDTIPSAAGCRCASNNAPAEPWQIDPQVVLDPRPHFPDLPEGWHDGRVAVDACIAPLIVALWEAGIWTVNSCCGHGGFYGPQIERTVILADPADREAAERIARDREDAAKMLAWELVDGSQVSETRMQAAVARATAALSSALAAAEATLRHVIRERDETFARMLARAEAAEAQVTALTAERDEARRDLHELEPTIVGEDRLRLELAEALRQRDEARARLAAAEAQVAALTADRGELGRQVRDLKKRAEGAESDRDTTRDVALEYEAQVAALTATGPGWQPIETAPKDGTWVLVASYRGAHLGWMSNARWRQPNPGGRPRLSCWFDGTDYMVPPTHWQPLPEPPQC